MFRVLTANAGDHELSGLARCDTDANGHLTNLISVEVPRACVVAATCAGSTAHDLPHRIIEAGGNQRSPT